MATSQPLMWKVMLEKVPKGIWLTNQEIYRIIQDNIELKKDDFEPAAIGVTSTRWQRNVRNIFQYRKKTGEMIWSGDGKYLIPDSNDPIAQTSSVATGH